MHGNFAILSRFSKISRAIKLGPISIPRLQSRVNARFGVATDDEAPSLPVGFPPTKRPQAMKPAADEEEYESPLEAELRSKLELTRIVRSCRAAKESSVASTFAK